MGHLLGREFQQLQRHFACFAVTFGFHDMPRIDPVGFRVQRSTVDESELCPSKCPRDSDFGHIAAERVVRGPFEAGVRNQYEITLPVCTNKEPGIG